MFVAITFCAVIDFCDVTNSEINLNLPIKPFFYIIKTNINISRMKRAFDMKWKVFFIIFKGLSIVRNCPKSKSGPVKE